METQLIKYNLRANIINFLWKTVVSCHKAINICPSAPVGWG